MSCATSCIYKYLWDVKSKGGKKQSFHSDPKGNIFMHIVFISFLELYKSFAPVSSHFANIFNSI